MSVGMYVYYAIILMTGISVYMLTTSVLEPRTQPHLRTFGVPVKKQFKLSELKIVQPLIPFTKPIANLPYMQWLQKQAEVLRLNIDMPGLILIKVVLSFFAGYAVMMITRIPGHTLIAGTLGFLIPDFMFFRKIKAKKAEISRIFPETVDLVDLCIGAGLDFTASLKWVIEKSAPNALNEQLETVLKEIQVGRNRVDALKDMSRRLNIPDINSFVRTVVQSERMGTSVEDAFRNLSEDTREMRFTAGERVAIKASLQILFPLLFCILPVIMIIVAGPIIIKFTEGSLIPDF
ncbi:type II secretion system F family protein [Candidatus Omnitrophota bacterium]